MSVAVENRSVGRSRARDTRRAVNPRDRENRRLCALAQLGDRAAAAELLRLNEPLIYAAASRYASARLPLEDALQLGRLGFVRAVAGYDGSSAFSTYLVLWVRAEAGKAALPPGLTTRGARRAFYVLLRAGSSISVAELASRASVSREDAEKALAAYTRKVATLAGDYPEPGEVSVSDASPSPEDSVVSASEAGQVQRLLGALDPRERRFVEDCVMGDEQPVRVAEREGISRERVRQIVQRGLGRLRAALEAEAA